MMGLPVGYTQMCMPKSMRKHVDYHDKRLTLVGNAWAVPVVAWLLGQLVGPRGAGPSLSPAEVLSRLTLEGNPFIQSRLMRPLQTDHRVGSSGLNQGIRSDDYSGAGRDSELSTAAAPHQCEDVAMEGCFRVEMAQPRRTYQLLGIESYLGMSSMEMRTLGRV